MLVCVTLDPDARAPLFNGDQTERAAGERAPQQTEKKFGDR
jgi:hypothetical protein